MNEADFRDSVLTVGFSEEQQVILSKFYNSKKKDISEILGKLTVDEPHYHDLNWRIEVQVYLLNSVYLITLLVRAPRTEGLR